MEWGGFDSHSVAGAATVYDYAVDREEDPTSQRFEKQISGRYLGEIVRKVCVHLMNSGILFANVEDDANILTAADTVFRQKHAFTTPMAAAIESSSSNHIQYLSENDNKSKFVQLFLKANDEEKNNIRTGWVTKVAMDSIINLNGCDSSTSFAQQSVMAHNFAAMWMAASEKDRLLITEVCQMVSTRAARLAAAAIVAVCRKTNKNQCTVAVDGSVFEKYPHFQTDMEHAIFEMEGTSRQLSLVHAEDGSGKGAAMIASCV